MRRTFGFVTLAFTTASFGCSSSTPPPPASSGATESATSTQAKSAPADARQPAVAHTKGKAQEDASLPPRTLFAGNPDYANVQVSPDGKSLSWLAPHEGVLNVWVAPLRAPDQGKPLTKVKDRPIRSHSWAHDGKHLIFEKDQGGDENFHLYKVVVRTGATTDLTDYPKTRASIAGLSFRRPKEILVALNDRDPRHHDLHVIDLATGKRKLVFQNDPGFSALMADADYKVRFAFNELPDGGLEILERSYKGQLTPFARIDMQDTMTTRPWGIETAGRLLYMADSRDRDTAAMFQVDLPTKKTILLAEDARADASEAIFHPKTKRLQAVSFNAERTKWKVVDPAITPDLDVLRRDLRGEFSVASRSLDDKQWIVVDVVDDGPVRYFRYDQAKKKLTLLFVGRKNLVEVPLTKMYPRMIAARDGLELVSYLSLPRERDPDTDGKPDQPIPLVLLVHGGPWARDRWGYNATHQWLATRGYATLSVNFRGSTGFGKKLYTAGIGEWSRKMHDDLLDAVDWAIKEGITTRDVVAIMGVSYGGYATLVGLSSTPDTFACGVDVVGPANLVTLLETIPPYWAPLLVKLSKMIGGDPRTEEGRKFLTERSPLSYAHQIKRPLLIGQGANDPRVKRAESDQIVKAMQEKNIPVSYVLFPDEGHGFARPENRLAFDAVAETFLAQCLGGRYQPIGFDFAGSSITVPVGADQITGVEAAIRAMTPR